MVLSPLEPLLLMLRDRKEHSQGYQGQPDSDSVLRWGWVTLQPMPGPPASREGGTTPQLCLAPLPFLFQPQS